VLRPGRTSLAEEGAKSMKPASARPDRPRVLHVVGSSKFGGDSVLVVELARAARERGFEVDILATDPRFQELIRQEGIGLVDLDIIRREIRPVWDLHGLVRLSRFLTDSPYTIVHTHTSKPGVVGRLAARHNRVPAIVHTVHLFGFHEESGPLARAAYSGIERRAARWCDRIITVSEYHREWALRLGIGTPEKLIAIPNGVPDRRAVPKRGRDVIRDGLDVGDDDFVILSTGRLAEQKGLEYLIRAVPLLLPAVPTAMVLLAGDGPLVGPLSRLIDDLGLASHVRLLGFRADVGDLLAAADVVALPSLWEGLSVSLLEAMAADRPVVTTTIGSNREVTRDGTVACLVPPKDPGALASAIGSLARDPDRRAALGRAAGAEQRSRYTMERMLGGYMEQYDLLLDVDHRAGRP
jgi:glycosyltransferase involved in cell wall biosynthesis